MKKIVLFLSCTFLIFQFAFSQLPVAIFSTDTNTLCPFYGTTFINLSTNATSYIWYFPGAYSSLDTSTEQNPVVYYQYPGQHDVTLIAINSNGSDTLTLANYVHIFPYPPPLGMMQSYDTLYVHPLHATYQWYCNGIAIHGATDTFVVMNQPGSYNVVAVDSNGCEVEAVIFDYLLEDQELISKTEITLFPNPATDELFISGSDLTAETELKIFNSMGKVVVATQYNKHLDVSGLQKGIYWVEINGRKNVFRKVILKL